MPDQTAGHHSIDEAVSAVGSSTALVSSGRSGLFGRVHPIGVVAAAITLAAIVAQSTGSEYLIANLSWWHWVLLVATMALSTSFAALDALRRAIESLSTFAVSGLGVGLRTGFLAAVVAGVLGLLIVGVRSGGEAGVTAMFGFSIATMAILTGPIWVLAWGVFILSLYSSLSRYLAKFISAPLIISEVSAMAWQAFALIALLGVGYGVREGVNPRIDFWWADFSKPRKALLDFVLHVTLFLPFLLMASRILWSYAGISLGYKPDRSGQGLPGEWPSGWRVWETWEQQGDAGQLPTGPIQAFIFVAFVLFALQVIADVIKHGFTLIGREDLGGFPEHDAPLRVE